MYWYVQETDTPACVCLKGAEKALVAAVLLRTDGQVFNSGTLGIFLSSGTFSAIVVVAAWAAAY